MPKIAMIQEIEKQSTIAKRRANKLVTMIRMVNARLQLDNDETTEDIAFAVWNRAGRGFTFEEIHSLVEDINDIHDISIEREIKYLKEVNAEVYQEVK